MWTNLGRYPYMIWKMAYESRCHPHHWGQDSPWNLPAFKYHLAHARLHARRN